VNLLDGDARKTLREEAAFDADFLELAFELRRKLVDVRSQIHVEFDDSKMRRQIAYPSSIFSDWRPSFLLAGAPLVLVSAFKALDMFVEAVLDVSKKRYSLEKKSGLFADRVRSTVSFGGDVDSRVMRSLSALYAKLRIPRNAIQHGGSFTTKEGSIQTSGGLVLSQATLDALASLAVSLVRCASGAWIYDEYQQKLIRCWLDALGTVHDQQPFGQPIPRLFNIRRILSTNEPTSIDLRWMRDGITETYGSECDVVVGKVLVSVPERPDWTVPEESMLLDVVRFPGR